MLAREMKFHVLFVQKTLVVPMITRCVKSLFSWRKQMPFHSNRMYTHFMVLTALQHWLLTDSKTIGIFRQSLQ